MSGRPAQGTKRQWRQQLCFSLNSNYTPDPGGKRLVGSWHWHEAIWWWGDQSTHSQDAVLLNACKPAHRLISSSHCCSISKRQCRYLHAFWVRALWKLRASLLGPAGLQPNQDITYTLYGPAQLDQCEKRITSNKSAIKVYTSQTTSLIGKKRIMIALVNSNLCIFSILEMLCKQFHSLSKEMERYLQDKNDIPKYLKDPGTLSGMFREHLSWLVRCSVRHTVPF